MKQAVARIGVAPEGLITATEAGLAAACDAADINTATMTPSASRTLREGWVTSRARGARG